MIPKSFEGLPLTVRADPRARRISLRLCAATGSVRLTLPPRGSLPRALAFLESHREWVRARAAALAPPQPFAPGMLLPLGDGQLLLAEGEGRVARLEGDTLRVPGTGALFAGRASRWLKAEARRRLEPQTHALAARLGRPVAEVRITDTRSRWGSCASGGRIAYSWRLLLAPAFVQQAVVAHEVAHLAEPNHGPAFWRLATDLLGASHMPARRWLKENGQRLHAIGRG